MSMYESIFDLIHTYIYGGVLLTSDMSLVCTLISTISCMLFFFIPFYVVYSVLKFIFGGIR